MPVLVGNCAKTAPSLAAVVASADPDRIDADVPREHLAADVDAATWKAWLRAYGRL
jgi:hypothetical protein